MAVVCERFDSLGREDAARRYRLGIMGGTFDPIHVGHLAAAEQVREAFSLDAVVFMPAGDPWMKKGRSLAPAEDRFAMVAAAVRDNPHFDASRLEIDRAGETYTVDTLRVLRSHYPDNVELYFISGADAMLRVHEWREAAELARLAHLVAVTRPGYSLDEARENYRCAHGADLSLTAFEVTPLEVSSTDLRKKVREGRSLRYLTPQVVADYIAAHSLYGELRGEEQ